MSHPLTAKGLELMDALPPFYWEDHITRAVQGAYGREVDRLDAFAQEVLDGLFATTASGSLLALWEQERGLPVDESLTLDQRRTRLVGRIRSRRMRGGAAWEAGVTAAIGTDGWFYQENDPGPYQLTIYAPFAPGSDALDATAQRVRPLTPAHIELAVSSVEGFIVDDSIVDEEVL